MLKNNSGMGKKIGMVVFGRLWILNVQDNTGYKILPENTKYRFVPVLVHL